MWRVQAARRIVVAIAYGLFSFVILYWLDGGNILCHGKTGVGVAVLRLAIGITVFDLTVSLAVILAYSKKGSSDAERWMLALLSGIVMIAVLIFLPGLLYKGDGAFWFEGTWADVSCLFREGYGITFPIVVAPIFAAMSFVREIIESRPLRIRVMTPSATPQP
jgi:hypothetical protein